MANYQIWVLNDDYSRSILFANTMTRKSWVGLRYRMALNGMDSATLTVLAHDPGLAKLDVPNQRLLILRDGQVVFGGRLDSEAWAILPTSPGDDDVYPIGAVGYAAYAQFRAQLPPAGHDVHNLSGPLDDVAKALIRTNLGSGADAARQYPDLTVAADVGLGAATHHRWRGMTVYRRIEDLAAEANGQLWWRFVPSETGVEFVTRWGLWGEDKSTGKAVFAIDRANFLEMAYRRDAGGHVNYIYAAGQGAGAARTIEIVQDPAAIAAWGRRERWLDRRDAEETEILVAEAEIELAKGRVFEGMTVVPRHNTWPGMWDLGDKVRVQAKRYGREYIHEAIVKSVTVTVTPDELEIVEPEFVTHG